VSTVSPTYAREIQTPEYGYGLAAFLSTRGDRVRGILNGIDTGRFNPAADPHLAATFDAETLERRTENRRELQGRTGLPPRDDVPLLGMVTRLYQQKGVDLAVGAIEQLLRSHDVQFVILGEGDDENEQAVTRLAERHPDHVAVRLAFDAPLGQLIYGGCDLFLMPSRYEPCGLGQMIAMRYGAVPVVRHTGGLADSVQPYAPDAGTGFVFEDQTAPALAAAIEAALDVFEGRGQWQSLQRRCMAQDWSWARAAHEYVRLYEEARNVRASEGKVLHG
jgi:starch synthase